MGATADEVLFIDNSLTYVDEARACGISAMLHQDNTTTMAAIREALHT